MENNSHFILRNGSHNIFSFLGTLLMVGGSFIIGQMPLGIIVSFIASRQVDGHSPNLEDMLLSPDVYGIDSRIVMALYIISFGMGLGALYAGLRWFHKQSLSIYWRSGVKPQRPLWIEGFIFLSLLIVFELLLWLSGITSYVVTNNPLDAFLTLIVAILIVPIQTSFEEFLFRGYLLQHFVLWFKRPWLAAILSSILFAGLHFSNPEVSAYGLGWMMSAYFIFGLFLSLITLMDGNLKLALWIHAINNIYGFALVSYPSSAMPLPSFFQMQNMPVEWTMIVLPILFALFYILIRKNHQWEPLNIFKTWP